jgi:hypothetical protein
MMRRPWPALRIGRTPRLRFGWLSAAAISLSIAAGAQAADQWFELKDFGPVTQRLAVTIENPADAPVEAALVHLPLAELRTKLPDARADQLCVVDPQSSPAKREAADANFIPDQVSNDTLIFALPLAAHETKHIYIYTAPRRLNMPGFPLKTAYDNRHAYRSFENNLIAYRMETGPGANTMGLGIDAFGKTARGKGLRLQQAYESHDYHKLADWGVDILKVGYGPAIGGIYVVVGDQMGRPQFASSIVDCVYSGPVETRLRCTAPVEIAGRHFAVTRIYTLIGDDRTVHSEDRIEAGPSSSLDGVTIGIGIRDLPSGKWTEKSGPGYAISAGESNQPASGYTSVAIAAIFPRSGFKKVVELDDAKKAKPGFGDGGHVYVLEPEKDGGALIARNRFTMIWNGDGEIDNAADLAKACLRWVAQRDHPIRVELATAPEVRP